MSLTTGTSPNATKTALDMLHFQAYEQQPGPDIAEAMTPQVFKQEKASKAAVITELYKGVGLWQVRAEQEDVHGDTPQVSSQQVFPIRNFSNSVDISKNFYDDDQYSVVSNTIKNMGVEARRSQNMYAMEVFRGATARTLTNDGVALLSNSHTTMSGANVDNLETGVLSESIIDTLITKLIQQLTQAGTIGGQMPSVLLVPPALYKKAVIITESELRSETANNDMNVYSSKYGFIVKQSPYLGSAVAEDAVNSISAGSDTAFFLLGNMHSVIRWVRQGLETTLVPWQNQRNNNYIYKGEYREQYGVLSYEGVVGSTGAGA